MNKNLPALSFLLLLILLTACRTSEIDHEIPFEGKKLVLASVLNANQPFTITVNQTFAPTGNIPKSTAVGNALVILKENNITVDTLRHEANGKYVSLKKYLPKALSKYSFEVSAEGFSDVKSEPFTMPSNTISFKYDTIHSFEPALSYKAGNDLFKISINTQNDSDEYYAIFFELGSQNYQFIEFFDESKSSDCYFTNYNNLLNSTKNTVWVFKNSCIQNKDLNIRFLVPQAETQYGNTIIFKPWNKPKLHIIKINKILGEYLSKQKQPEGSGLIFQAPHKTFSNINNGYGIVSGVTEKIVELEILCDYCTK